MSTRFLRAVIATVFLVATGTVAALPIATLTFTTPTGTVSPTDSIDVYFTLALDPASVALTTDASGQVTSGLNVATDLPWNFDPLAGFTSSYITNAFGCSTTFTTSCTTGPPYNFAFNSGTTSLNQPLNLNISPGTSQDFLFGTFTPTGGGPVAPGTYVFPYAVVWIAVSGLEIDGNGDPVLDAGGNQNTVFTYLTVAGTCPTQDLTCSTAFSRTVVGTSVPEPASLALMSLGLAGLGFARRRKSA